MTAGWAGKSSSKRASWSLSGPEPGIKRPPDRAGFSLGGHSFSSLCLLCITNTRLLSPDTSGHNCPALSWRWPQCPNVYQHSSRKSPSLRESQFSTSRTENLPFRSRSRNLALPNKLRVEDIGKSSWERVRSLKKNIWL